MMNYKHVVRHSEESLTMTAFRTEEVIAVQARFDRSQEVTEAKLLFAGGAQMVVRDRSANIADLFSEVSGFGYDEYGKRNEDEVIDF